MIRNLHHWFPALALGSMLVLAFAACSKDHEDSTWNVDENDGENDGENNGENADPGDDEALQLQGEVVPSAGTSLSDDFTLSGQVAPGYEPTEAESQDYRLQLEPPTVTETQAIDPE